MIQSESYEYKEDKEQEKKVVEGINEWLKPGKKKNKEKKK